MTLPLACRGKAKQRGQIRGPLIDLGLFDRGRIVQPHGLPLAHHLTGQGAVHGQPFGGRQGLPQSVLNFKPGLIRQQQDGAARRPDQPLGFGADDIQHLIQHGLLEQTDQHPSKALALGQPSLQFVVQVGILQRQGRGNSLPFADVSFERVQNLL